MRGTAQQTGAKKPSSWRTLGSQNGGRTGMCNDRPPIGRNSGLVLSCSNTCLPSSGSGPFLAWLFHDLLDAREQRQGPEQEPKERGMGRASKGQRRSSAPFGDGEGEQTRRSPLAASGNAQAKAQMVTYILCRA